MSERRPLLQRQIKRLQMNEASILSNEQFNDLLLKVSETYTQLNSHIERQDKMLEVMDREYRGVFSALEMFNAKLTQTIEEKTLQLLARENSIENQKYVALGEMAAGIAHEINNPLAIIVATASTLQTQIEKKDLDFFKITEKINRIIQVSNRIAKIIEGIRIFSRQSKDTKTQLTKVSQIIKDTLLLCNERLNSLGIVLKCNISEFDMIVDVRAIQISQVLLNLLNNAIDVLEKYDKEKEIEIVSVSEGDFICIRIFDSGPGIPDTLKERIMEPFLRLKKSEKAPDSASVFLLALPDLTVAIFN